MRTIGLDPEALVLARPHRRSIAMRTRAYRPEAPVGLEDRSLQSGVAGLPAHPVVLPLRRFNFIIDHMRQGFNLFVRNHDPSHLRYEIDDVVVLVPFGRVDGLDVLTSRIVTRMLHDLAAHVPHAISSAQNDVIAATGAEVRARIQAGDVVLR
jgi:hypothetical protein